MATYNGEKYIDGQLSSILGQLGEEDEIVISDDSSADRTLEIIEGFHDNRIRIFRGGTFHSPIFNFENALKNAHGEHIYLADQDDIWEADKVAVTEEAFRTNDLVVSDATVIDADGHVLHESFYKLRNSGRGYFKNLYKNSYVGCCMAISRALLTLCLPFPRCIPMHDSWMGLMAELNGKPVFIDDKLVRYRRHSDNASPTGEKSSYSVWEKFLHRERLLRCTAGRTIQYSMKHTES